MRKPKPGRPPKQDKTKRIFRFTVGFTVDELDAVRERAASEGLDVPEFIRSAAVKAAREVRV